MSVRIAFRGGPADGSVTDYPRLDAALPSLYWSSDDEHRAAVYRRTGSAPDPVTGAWTYSVATT